MGRARPVYTPELAREICRRLTEGETLKVICRDDGMPAPSTVRLWVLDNVKAGPDDPEGFVDLYARARLVGYLGMADELLEIADDGTGDYVEKERPDGSKFLAFDGEHVQRSRLRVDTRNWILAKALPKIYGDKLAAEVTGEDGGPIETTYTLMETARLVTFLLTASMQERGEGEKAAEGPARH